MAEIRTQYIDRSAKKSAKIMIFDKREKPYVISLGGRKTLGREYPEADADIRLESAIVGRAHGEFLYSESQDAFYYIDNNSTNGTFVNGVKLEKYNERGTKPYKLSDGDILRIDRRTLKSPHPEAVLMIFSYSFDLDEEWRNIEFGDQSDITIGRGENNAICLDDMMASRQHAVIRSYDNRRFISDKKSQNGIIVNGKRITGTEEIFNHDVIRIANTTLLVLENQIFYNNPGERARALSVHIRKKEVGFKKKVLIRDIHFEADTGDFVLILGGSGAGKTTLVNAILGDGKVDAKVMLDGMDLYANFKTMKSQIGLVPQFTNLRLNDKVNQTLMDIAEVKLDKRYYSKADKIERINEIMERLGVSNLQNHLICQLSGGQKKKISVAAQLVGFQKVFICDEPDSGLDAASRVQQMEILKEISENGKIVMVISHEPDDAVDSETNEILFTKVIVLAKSKQDNAGHLAFFGSPQEALEYFGVTRLQDIMKEINPDFEGGKGRGDYYIQKYNKRKEGISNE